MPDISREYEGKISTFKEHDLHESFGMAWEVGKGSAHRPNVSVLEWVSKKAPLLSIDLCG